MAKYKWKSVYTTTKKSDLPESNQRPRDYLSQTTVSRSTNWAKVGCWKVSIQIINIHNITASLAENDRSKNIANQITNHLKSISPVSYVTNKTNGQTFFFSFYNLLTVWVMIKPQYTRTIYLPVWLKPNTHGRFKLD